MPSRSAAEGSAVGSPLQSPKGRSQSAAAGAIIEAMNRIAQLAAILHALAIVSTASIARGTRHLDRHQQDRHRHHRVTSPSAMKSSRSTLSPFPSRSIHALKLDEMNAVFAADGPDGLEPKTTGNLFRISIPGDKKFLHKNTLCGSEEVTWVVSARQRQNPAARPLLRRQTTRLHPRSHRQHHRPLRHLHLQPLNSCAIPGTTLPHSSRHHRDEWVLRHQAPPPRTPTTLRQ